ncbi:MAG: hypothetical protein IKX25_00770 [Bacteroidales bacterium]|nr:hypothetical protein [Bacteroidales bacterium]
MHIRQKLFFLNHSYNTAFVLSLLCYTLSMCFISVRAGSLEIHGFYLLLFGWMSFGLNSYFLCWLANILYVVSACIVIRKAKSLFWLSLPLPVLGILLVFCETFPNYETGQDAALSLSTGYWLWYVALLLITLACILLRIRNARKEPEYSRRFGA